jgi:hypothetical protein
MMNRLLLLALALGLFSSTAVPAARAESQKLSIRLVLAGQGSQVDPALKDVASLVRGNLAFSSYKLLETASVPLPASGSVRMGKNFKVSLSGPASNLDVTVTQGASSVIKTRAVLRGRSPLVLGGIPSRDGTYLFVLNLVN